MSRLLETEQDPTDAVRVSADGSKSFVGRGNLLAGVTQRSAEIVARETRARAARRVAIEFKEHYDGAAAQRLVADSPFRRHVRDYTADDPYRLLAFNLEVTKHSIAQLCATSDDPATLAFAAARISELGLHSLLDPDRLNSDPTIWLAAAKEWGYFTTPPEIAALLADRAIGGREGVADVLDPAAGSGALLAAVALRAAATGTQLTALNGVEADPFTAGLCERVVRRTVELLGLDTNVRVIAADATEYLLPGPHRPAMYDCVVMNPPYGRAKFLRSTLTNAETRTSTARRDLETQDADWKRLSGQRADRFRELSALLGLGVGAQNNERIFIAFALSVLSASGRLAFIAPSTWLGDHEGRALRRLIVGGRLLEELILFREGIGLFSTVNQPTAIAVISHRQREHYLVRSAVDATSIEPGNLVDYQRHTDIDGVRLRIPRISGEMYSTYMTLNSFPHLGTHSSIHNARGELDLTFGRRYVKAKPTSHRLLRGDHIERFVVRPVDASSRDGFVDFEGYIKEFSRSSKLDESSGWRIAGRQVSYLEKSRRLSFALVPPNVVLANSCNYVTVRPPGDRNVLLKALVVLLNSLVLEWYFRIFNSNNHVANYEIDELPLCLENPMLVGHLARLADFLQEAYASSAERSKSGSRLEDVADAIVAHGFGLDASSIEAIARLIAPDRAARVAAITEWLRKNGIPDSLTAGDRWPQHLMPTLSELDKAVIRHVPQGGNWQDVPESVPSRHIQGIREMTSWRGVVRTSYYGRLRPDQPAYTIATYFNRPGNGTNIHPWEDRTLTTREAARLQSFPDWYSFLGPETSIRKQVGNAVPPLLAYALGRHLRSLDLGGPCVDLFAGAGGLSLGLELADIPVVAAVDNNKWAAQTYTFNRPCEATAEKSAETLFLESDLTDPATRSAVMAQLYRKLAGRQLAILVGGPPCQGFSHAGWRTDADERNELASVFMKFVEKLGPALVILENVEGLLTFGRGRVMRDLVATLHDLGYDTGSGPWLLRAEMFGVPQMRRRVFLVGNRVGLDLKAPKPLLQQCLGRRELDQQPRLLENLAYPVTAAEALHDLPRLSEATHFSHGKRPIRRAFADWAKDYLSVDELFASLSIGD